jgi:O-antigen/teichoic acid export membrane protein
MINPNLTATSAMTLRVITTGLAFVVAIFLLRMYRPAAWSDQPATYQTKVWLVAALPLLFIQMIEFANQRTDQLLLGSLGPEAVGIYAVASKGADIITMVLTAFYVVLAPTIARLNAADQRDQLQRAVTKGVRGVFIIVLPIALALIFGGAWFLGLFGESFVEGRSTLTILATVTMLNVAFGPVGLLLIMSGYERIVAVGNAIRFVIYVPVSFMLIEALGINGAALGKGLSVVFWNAFLLVLVHRRLKIDASIFGRIKLLSHKKS